MGLIGNGRSGGVVAPRPVRKRPLRSDKHMGLNKGRGRIQGGCRAHRRIPPGIFGAVLLSEPRLTGKTRDQPS
jgi:hypothetical protein